MSFRDLPAFRDLRTFLRFLEERRLLARIGEPISLVHDLTEAHRRVLLAGGPGAPVRERGGREDAGPRQPVRHGRAGGGGVWRRPVAGQRTRRDAGRPARAGAVRRPARCARPLADGSRGALDPAEPRVAARLPGGAAARRRRRSRPPADPDLLAGRAGAADHLAHGDHPAARHGRRRYGAYEHRRLSHAGSRQGPRHHALAAAARRRRASSGMERAGQGYAGRGGDRRRSGDHPLGRPAVAGDGVGTALLGRAARRAAADCARADRAADGSRRRGNRDRGVRLGDGDGARRPLRRPHRLLQQRRIVSRHADHRDHLAARSDLPHHLHRQAAGRALGDRRRAQRSRHPDDAPADAGDRRRLAAAGSLLLSHGDHLDPQVLPWTGAPRDDGTVGHAAAVQLHQDHHCRGRGHRRARLEGRRLGAGDANGRRARHGRRGRIRRSTTSISPRPSRASAASSASTPPRRSAPRPRGNGAGRSSCRPR